MLVPRKVSGGRNVHGHITCRHKGGGHKRMIRILDFKRDKRGIEGKVVSIEYDPNRSARIALVEYSDGEKRYILAPSDLKVGTAVVASENAEIKSGNHMPLGNIPLGTFIHNIELLPGRGGQAARSAGNFCQVVAKEGNVAHVKMPSGEVRLFNLNCWATLGQVGNEEHKSIMIGKAGRTRHLGIRPSVRGRAMNPHDHPMGGGEGKSSGFIKKDLPLSFLGRVALLF